jgi:hypothetical protein
MPQKFILALLGLFNVGFSFGQGPEHHIPEQAVTVFSINNQKVLSNISLNELISYDFMDEIHQELFDRSTENKTLEDAGMDFNKRLNVFYGKTNYYELSGFTFGISNQQNLFQALDDFEAVPSPYPGIQLYRSFFNHLLIDKNNALLIRVEPLEDYVNQLTDSSWYSRGNLPPFYNEEEDPDNPDYNPIPQENNEINEKNYYELRDSLQYTLNQEYLTIILKDLYVSNNNLFRKDSNFRDLLTHEAAGVFFMDNSRNIDRAKNLWYLKTFLPTLYLDVQDLYEGNIITGDLLLLDQQIQFNLKAHYGDALGSIYTSLNDAKFDKNISNYIKKNQAAYFTYNVNLRNAYEKAFEVIVPILSKTKDPEVSYDLLMVKLANALINKDALFDAAKGSMFITFGGIEKVKTKRIEFFYDEVTFEYGEREAEAEEDMPIFTIGFSTKRQDIPEMMLEHLSQVTSKFQKQGDLWVYNKAIFEAAPLYLLNKKDLFILTNDSVLAKQYPNGYGKDRLSKKTLKGLKNAGSMAGYADLQALVNKFPKEFLSGSNQALIESLRSKSGTMHMHSGKTSKNSTEVQLTYDYTESLNSGKYLLDLINTLYLLNK